MLKRISFLLSLLFLMEFCSAHGFGGSGLLHPLTGIDHILAMVAVGAWSGQIGGKGIYLVPSCFLLMMVFGGIAGTEIISIPNIDWLIAFSIILLGLAIFIDRKISILIAGLAVGAFGFTHGYAHGAEMSHNINVWKYILGFTITTFGLHVIGAVGGLLILENKNGPKQLRLLGAITALLGIYLLVK